MSNAVELAAAQPLVGAAWSWRVHSGSHSMALREHQVLYDGGEIGVRRPDRPAPDRKRSSRKRSCDRFGADPVASRRVCSRAALSSHPCRRTSHASHAADKLAQETAQEEVVCVEDGNSLSQKCRFFLRFEAPPQAPSIMEASRLLQQGSTLPSATSYLSQYASKADYTMSDSSDRLPSLHSESDEDQSPPP
jgi:hypothetical protein